MSEPRLISPLLDGFVMGGPISDHDGVRCCPAMRENSDDKYIVKVISIPASQVQLDALLLSGAYRDKNAALAYFKDLADSTVKEAEVLKRLAKLDGFASYEGWQIVPKEQEVGYDVYLLGSYKRSLQKQMSRQPMTHLGAVNLGLDMCSALAVCRRAGCLYVDLKPENIYVFDEQTYRIGDLGFVPLSSLRYASLPEKYRSSFTAPEISDAYAALNTTIDIYALGLILYQVYNNGVLPFDGSAPAAPLPAPMYADYEMAEIILKACAPKPEDRWQDPAEMGQALVSYMQRNGVNATLIVPLPGQDSAEEPVDECDTTEDIPQDAAPMEFESSDESTFPEEIHAPKAEDTVPPAEAAPVTDGESQEEDPAAEDDLTDLSFIDGMVSDETAPTEESAVDLIDAELTEEASAILAQADELIAHETPDPVVAPGPIDVPMPDPIAAEPEPEDAPEDAEVTGVSAAEPAEEAAPAAAEPAADIPAEGGSSQESEKPKKKKKGRWLIILLVLAILAGLGYGGYYFYENYYLQNIDALSLHYADSFLHVSITSQIPDEDLTVYCTDTYGNAKFSDVKDGSAAFTDLKPSTQYTIRVEMAGFHKLTGKTEETYTTPAQTNIASFSAKTGAENGSVILTFTVDGTDPTGGWVITYTADGEEAKTEITDSHWTTITGLTPGKEYTFQLSSNDQLDVAGTTELVYTASNVITAQDLSIDSCADGALTVSWSAPEGAAVESWTVRCYSDAGYDETLEVTETTASFSNIDISSAYNIDVTAAGMTQNAHAYMTANPITIVSVLPDAGSALNLQWGYDGADPAGGWLVMCSVDGSAIPDVIKTEANSLSLSPLLPGSQYVFTFQAADGATVFNGSYTYDAPEAPTFSSYGVAAEDMTFKMLKRPEKENWTWYDAKNGPFVTTFASGQKASFLVALDHWQDKSRDEISIMYVIRDENGTPVIVDTQTRVWNDMWNNGYCCMDVPELPATAGTYTLEIFFNANLAATQEFTIE